MQALLAVVAREMHVPEDEVVDVVLGGIPAGIFDQRLGKRDIDVCKMYYEEEGKLWHPNCYVACC